MGDPDDSLWVFGIGVRGRPLSSVWPSFRRLVASQEDYLQAHGRLRTGPFLYSPTQLVHELRSELPRAVRQRAAVRLGRSR